VPILDENSPIEAIGREKESIEGGQWIIPYARGNPASAVGAEHQNKARCDEPRRGKAENPAHASESAQPLRCHRSFGPCFSIQMRSGGSRR
jgi:hypothetical protein